MHLRGKSSWAAPALALLALTVAACGGSGGPKKVPPNAVAIVGDVPITRAEVGAILAAHRRSAAGQQSPSPGTPEFRTERDRIVRELVQDAELEQRAKSDFGIEISDQQVDQQVAELRRRDYSDSEARLQAALLRQGITETELRQRIRQQLLAGAVFDKFGTKTSVSDAEIEKYYRSHLEGYRQPASRPVSNILVSTRAEADRLERRLKAGADFAALARRYSTDPATASAGGRIAGGIVQGQAAPAIEQAAFSLETNTISAPIHTKIGYEILRATAGMRPARTTPLSTVRDTIESQLLLEKKKTEVKQWVAETKAAYAKKIAYAPGFRPAT